MLRATRSRWIFVGVLLPGCGGKVVFSEGDGGSGDVGAHAQNVGSSVVTAGVATSGSGGFSCAAVSFDFRAPIEACTTGQRCDIVGTLPDGRALRETCSGDGPNAVCDLFIDEQHACSCSPDQIDFGASCGNGTPTCDSWLVDYGDISFCAQP